MTDEARLQRWLNGQRRSHQRTFQSREMVWTSFEGIARESGTSMDQLISEAMEAYAEQRGYRVPEDPPEENQRWASSPYMQEMAESRDPLEETRDAPSLDDLDRSYQPPSRQAPPPRRAPPPLAPPDTGGWDDDNGLARTETRGAVRRPSPALDIREPGEESRTSPRYLQGRHPSSPSAPTNVSPAAVPAAISRPVPTPAAGSYVSRGTRPLQPPGAGPNRSAPPPPLPPPQQQMRQQLEPPKLRDTGSNPAAMKRLLLTHNGRQVEVDKDRFLLGRSKTQADLRLEDPNVSRQHAAIERVGSAWFIVDLGSTNGIFVNGQRVARRALADGDVIVITSQEIRCSVR
jgi:hypothetical protein